MNKKLLSTAVATTLGAVIAAPAAQANDYYSALIPYVVKDANRTTVVTLIGSGWANSSGGPLHLQYWTKSTTAANTSACEPSSVTIPITPNDIVTFDTGGLLGYPLFGDTTNPAALGTSIGYPSPRHGYLVAEFQSGFGEGAYWLELDLANGGAYGDAGITTHAYVWYGGPSPEYGDNFAMGFPTVKQRWADLSFPGANYPVVFFPLQGLGASWDLDDIAAEQHTPVGGRAVNFWPTSIASTVFTVTPLGTAMVSKENNSVVLQVANSNGVQGAYDRNENGIDGTVPVTVRCVGRVSPSQLMPGVVSNAAWAAQGGWGFLHNLGNNDTNPYELYGQAEVTYVAGFGAGVSAVSYAFGTFVANDLPAMIYQVDSSSAGGKFLTNATRIESKSVAQTIFDYDWVRYPLVGGD